MIVSPISSGMLELPEGRSTLIELAVTVASKSPLTAPRNTVRIFVVEAGYITWYAFFQR